MHLDKKEKIKVASGHNWPENIIKYPMQNI